MRTKVKLKGGISLIVLVITGQLQIWNMYSRAAETIIDNFNCTCILQSSRHNIIIGGDNFISELILNNYQIETFIELRDGEILFNLKGKVFYSLSFAITFKETLNFY